MAPNPIYRHKKTGTLYRVTAIAIDCTNSRANDDNQVIVYEAVDYKDPPLVFVREAVEFMQKFERV